MLLLDWQPCEALTTINPGMPMMTLLPHIASVDEFYKIRGQSLEFWQGAIEYIRTGPSLDGLRWQRFSGGEFPVFNLDEKHVVKLTPVLFDRVLSSEVKSLRFLSGKTSIPVSQLLGSDSLDGWSYVVSTCLPGKPLHLILEQMTPDEKIDIAFKFGRLLAKLHDIPIGSFNPTDFEWRFFCHQKNRALVRAQQRHRLI